MSVRILLVNSEFLAHLSGSIGVGGGGGGGGAPGGTPKKIWKPEIQAKSGGKK